MRMAGELPTQLSSLSRKSEGAGGSGRGEFRKPVRKQQCWAPSTRGGVLERESIRTNFLPALQGLESSFPAARARDVPAWVFQTLQPPSPAQPWVNTHPQPPAQALPCFYTLAAATTCLGWRVWLFLQQHLEAESPASWVGRGQPWRLPDPSPGSLLTFNVQTAMETDLGQFCRAAVGWLLEAHRELVPQLSSDVGKGLIPCTMTLSA